MWKDTVTQQVADGLYPCWQWSPAELHDSHSMPNIMMTVPIRMRWTVYDAYMGRGKKKILWGFSRNTGREEAMWMTRYRWKDNNKNGYSKSRMWMYEEINLGHDSNQWWGPVNIEISLWVPDNMETAPPKEFLYLLLIKDSASLN